MDFSDGAAADAISFKVSHLHWFVIPAMTIYGYQSHYAPGVAWSPVTWPGGLDTKLAVFGLSLFLLSLPPPPPKSETKKVCGTKHN